MRTTLAEIEAKAASIEAKTVSLKADLTALSVAIIEAGRSRDLEMERVMDTADELRRQIRALEDQLAATKQGHAVEIATHEKVEREQIQEAIKGFNQLKAQAEATQQALAKSNEAAAKAEQRIEGLSAKLQAERQAHEDDLAAGATATTKKMEELQALADLLRDRHDWHVEGATQAHGWKKKIVYQCSGCPARILADKDFLA